MKLSAIIIFVFMTTAAAAQDFTMMVGSDNRLVADWPNVVRCSKKPYPKTNDKDPNSREMADHYFHAISGCRWALATRHAVWIEAGRSPQDNPFPPATMSRRDDFKRELVCDYSKLDKDGVGTVHCNADKW